MLNGLWGPDSKFASLEVILKDNQVVLREHYSNRREEADLINKGKSVTQVKQRIWQRTQTPQ